VRYTIIGNGNPNTKEVVKTLASLANDDTRFVLVGYEDPSPATKAILSWMGDRFDYDLVVPAAFDLLDEYKDCARIITAKRPVARALAHSASETDSPTEEWCLLVMSHDIDHDEDALFAINACIDNGVEVFDLGGQMAPLTIEQDAPTVVEQIDPPQPVVEEADVLEALKLASQVSPDQLDGFTREELEELTRDELKSIVGARGLVPKDMRSKESLIEAILGVSTDTGTVPATKGTDRQYYLLTVFPDQSISMDSLTVEQFSQLTF
jgi:hypothetical protein